MFIFGINWGLTCSLLSVIVTLTIIKKEVRKMTMEQQTDTALILVDVQIDFCPGGALAVPEGDEVVEPINRLLERGRERGWLLLASRDYHPADTTHFADFGGVWPIHCVQGTLGAKFHPDLLLEEDITVITKGTGKDENAYSAFDGKTLIGMDLETFLKLHKVSKIYVTGLATDYCVKATAIDAAKRGFETVALEDAIAAVNINPDDGDKAVAEMKAAGVEFAKTGDLIAGLL